MIFLNWYVFEKLLQFVIVKILNGSQKKFTIMIGFFISDSKKSKKIIKANCKMRLTIQICFVLLY